MHLILEICEGFASLLKFPSVALFNFSNLPSEEELAFPDPESALVAAVRAIPAWTEPYLAYLLRGKLPEPLLTPPPPRPSPEDAGGQRPSPADGGGRALVRVRFVGGSARWICWRSRCDGALELRRRRPASGGARVRGAAVAAADLWSRAAEVRAPRSGPALTRGIPLCPHLPLPPPTPPGRRWWTTLGGRACEQRPSGPRLLCSAPADPGGGSCGLAQRQPWSVAARRRWMYVACSTRSRRCPACWRWPVPSYDDNVPRLPSLWWSSLPTYFATSGLPLHRRSSDVFVHGSG